MHILFHLGAHCTDEGLLIRSILRNRAVLATEGILVPGPSRYRELIGDVSTSLRGAPASAETEAMLMEVLCDDHTAERLVLSSENFLCRETVVLSDSCLYPKADKAAWLANCFPSHVAEFAIAVRNPATFLPDIVARLGRSEDTAAAVATAMQPERLRWSEMIRRMSDATAGARIFVWCHEDSPFLWSQIRRELTQHDPFTELEGALDMAERIMTPEGTRRLQDLLANRSSLTEAKRRTAISTFLEAHALPEVVETVIDLPGWTHGTVERLTELYDDDVAEIARIPGVVFLSP